MERRIAERLWLRRHRAGERRFATVLTSYFDDQADRLADQLADFGAVSTALVPIIFHAEQEHQKLMALARPQLLNLMVVGAQDQLDQHGRKDWSDLAFEAIDLPDVVAAAIRRNLAELEQQSYWRDIQRVAEQHLTDILEQGLHDGDSNHRISMTIRESLGGYSARRRALVIARTESTGCLNAGHDASYQELAAEGVVVGKEWLTVGDNRVRGSHEPLQGVIVGARENFIVGGTPAPYPGWYGLPGQQRIMCRCTTIAAFEGD